MSEQPSRARKAKSKDEAMPVEVEILTQDHEICGLIYVTRDTDEKRRISELLNDPERRFLAVTDAKMINRKGPGTARQYAFLQVNVDSIQLLHPSTQTMGRQVQFSASDANRLEKMRGKLKQGR